MPRALLAPLLAVLLAPAAGRAADLNYPPNALTVVRLEPQPLWQHDLMKTVRETITAAGPKAVAAFTKQVYPDPAQITAVSVIALPPADGRGPPVVVVRLDLSEPIDTARVVRLYVPNPTMTAVGGQPLFANPELAVAFPTLQQILVSDPAMLNTYLQRPKAADGPMTEILKPLAGKPLFAAVNVKALPIPPQAFEQIPEPIRPLAKADRVTLALDLDKTPVMRLRVGYATEAAATDAEGAVKAAAGMLKQLLAGPRAEMERKLFDKADDGPRKPDDVAELAVALLAVGAANRANALLDAPPVTRDGSALTASVELPGELGAFGPSGTAVAIGLLLPAVQKVREAAARAQSQNNLKQIALAFHNYDSALGHLPDNIYSKDGKPLLSWRVAILPYIEQDALYKQFKLDEPWDSEHNKPLSKVLVKIYTLPATADRTPPGFTHYQGVVGKKGGVRTLFVEGGARTTFPAITDGTSNTILVGEAAEAVEWTRPADISFTPGRPVAFGRHTSGGFNVALCDGSVRFVSPAVDPKVLEALVTINGGEVVPFDR